MFCANDACPFFFLFFLIMPDADKAEQEVLPACQHRGLPSPSIPGNASATHFRKKNAMSRSMFEWVYGSRGDARIDIPDDHDNLTSKKRSDQHTSWCLSADKYIWGAHIESATTWSSATTLRAATSSPRSSDSEIFLLKFSKYFVTSGAPSH